MIVKDEERSLERCLQSAAGLVDDIIVADTGSRDGTKAIAERMGARVLEFMWVDDFSAARNFALDHSDGDWNLVLDADEYLHPCSRESLEHAIGLYGDGGSRIGTVIRYDSYLDEEEVSFSSSAIPRLLPRGVRYTGPIHEQPVGSGGCFPTPLEADHDGYLYMDKGGRNLPYLEAAVARYPEDPYYRFQMAVTLRNLKHLQESLHWFREFYHGSEEDGEYRAQGIVLYLYTLLDIGDGPSLLEALEVIEKEHRELEYKSDYCFVCGLFYMKLVLSDVNQYINFLPRIEACYLQCLDIGEHPEHGGVVGTGSYKAAYNLGLWYEVSGQIEKAVKYYRKSSKSGYKPAINRLKSLTL